MIAGGTLDLMPQRTDSFDLARLRLSSGEGRRLDLHVTLEALDLSGQRYALAPDPAPLRLDVSRTTQDGWALRMRFETRLEGPCMRCLEPAAPAVSLDAREVDQPGAGEELDSPYVREAVLDLRAWARDTVALALPSQVLCRPDCAGICPVCGADLNQAGPEHGHERAPDPRWAKLRELQ